MNKKENEFCDEYLETTMFLIFMNALKNKTPEYAFKVGCSCLIYLVTEFVDSIIKDNCVKAKFALIEDLINGSKVMLKEMHSNNKYADKENH